MTAIPGKQEQPDRPISLAVETLKLFETVLALPPGNRIDFIDSQIVDEGARAQIRCLLEAHRQSEGFLEPSEPAAALPEVLGPYRLIEPLGGGGMGQVWLAERIDGAFEQRVAIKILAPHLSDADSIRRAESERQFLAWLDHPNIARVLDGGRAAGLPYVVMEWIDGQRIDAWCNDHKLDLRTRVRLFLQVLAAVDAAHRTLIIHRDLKPSNVLVTRDGIVKLLDFGIAKSLDVRRPIDRTRTGLMPMTPQYASPEQIAGLPLTTACDIYALGLLLYEMLIGKPVREEKPLSIGDLARLADPPMPTKPSYAIDPARLSLDARALGEWRRQLGGDLDRIILKALAAEPARRYLSAQAFSDDLKRWLDRRPVDARGDGLWYRIGKFIRRNHWAVTASAVATVAIIAGLTAALVQGHRAIREAERARQANSFLIDMISHADPFISGDKPTMEEALNRAKDRIADRFSTQPSLEADIRHAIGRAYLSLNRLDDARTQLERSAMLRVAGDPGDHAEALNSLAILEWSYGHYQEGERLFRQAIDVLDASSREFQRDAIVRNDFSALLNELGRYEEAHAHASQALALAADLPDLPAQDRAAMLGNLGYALHGLGQLEPALDSYQKSQVILQRNGPTPHPDLAINFNNQALVLDELDRKHEALFLQEESVRIRREVFGDQHPALTQALVNLAVSYARAARLTEAKETILEALAKAPAQFAENNQTLGHVYRNAADVLLAVGDPAQASLLARRAIDVYDRAETVGPERREQAETTMREAESAAAAARQR